MRAARSHGISMAVCVLAIVVAGVARADPLAAGSRVCLRTPGLPFAQAIGDDRGEVLEQKLRTALEAAAFEVVPSSDVEPLVERITDASEAIFDPVTGRPIPEKREALQHAVADALRRELGCAARIWPRVVVVHALVDGLGQASWDGARQVVGAPRQHVVMTTTSAWLTALSLWIHATDIDGDDLAFRSAGIERIVDPDWYPLRLDILPEDAWLRDEERLDEAIDSALGPGGAWLRTRGSAEALARALRGTPPEGPKKFHR